MMRAMKFRERKPPLVLVLVLALLLLLPVLAWFQYRWLGQVSQAERERMLSNLKRATNQFSQDFNYELTQAYIHFQASESITSDQLGAHYQQLWNEWKSKSSNSRLISDLYWVENLEKDPTLTRLDVATGKFIPVDWLPELDDWRARTKDAPRELPEQVRMFLEEAGVRQFNKKIDGVPVRESKKTAAKQNDKRPPIMIAHSESRKLFSFVGQAGAQIRPFADRIIDEVPAIMITIPNRSNANGADLDPKNSVAGYILAKVDLSYVNHDFLPALSQRHFGTDRGLDYQVLVTSRSDPKRIIFQTDSNFSSGTPETSDSSAGLFAVRVEDLVAQSLSSGKQDVVFRPRPDRMTLKVVTQGGKGPVPTHLISELEGYWQVYLKHRAGSLEAAVGSVRRRSLGISFGVLLLLGASIALLLISTRRAQRLAEQQMEFVAGVSHELRTPLAVIRSAAENLADGYIGDPTQVKRYGAVIRDEGRRLTDMVEQVLEVAGVQSGRKAYQLYPTDPQPIIEQAINACHLLVLEANVTIEAKIDERLPLIAADATALNRAIQNLINNAIKYGGEKGWVGISAEAVKVDGGGEVRITVADRGIGIAPTDLPHIFEPFYRGREVIAAQIHGSGLGLSLVKHIVEAHGGRISVTSESGKGTSITLTLPAVEVQAPATELSGGYEQARPAH
jgi:two-component system sensor histidine kinase SenX3